MDHYKEEGNFDRFEFDGVKISRSFTNFVGKLMTDMNKCQSINSLNYYERTLMGYLLGLSYSGAISKQMYDRYSKLVQKIYHRKAREVRNNKKGW